MTAAAGAGFGAAEREALAEQIWEALDAAHDNARHVHASECCWSFPGALAAISDRLAAADRDAGLRAKVIDEHQWTGGYFCACGHELNSPRGYLEHVFAALDAS